MKFSRFFMVTTLAVSCLSLVHAADTIKGTVITDGGPAKQFVLEPGTPFVLDERRVEKYVGFVGCQGIDTSGVKDQVTVGRYVEIKTTPVSNDGVAVHINYLASKFNGIKPFEAHKGCVINNGGTSSFEMMPSIYLKRGEPQTIDLMIVPNIHKIQLLLE